MPVSILKSIKKRFVAILIFLDVAALLLIAGCSGDKNFNQDRNFRQFTKELFRSEVSSDTISLHYSLKNPKEYGISDPPVCLGSFAGSENDVIASAENLEAVLKSFLYGELSKENRLTYDILKYYLEQNKKSAPFLLYEEPLGAVGGIQTQFPVILSEFPFRCKEDVKVYLKLMQSVPEYFKSLEEFERKKSGKGLFMPDFAAIRVISQCNDFMEMGEGNYLFSTFLERLDGLDITSAEKEQYIKSNAQMMHNYVFPAYSHLASVLQDLRGTGRNEEGLCYLPDGKRFYEIKAESQAGTDKTVEEMKEISKEQIRSDIDEMKKAAEEINKDKAGKESLKEKEPGLMLAELKNKIRAAFPAAPASKVTVKYVPKDMEPHLSPAFYMIPPVDYPSENVIYVNRRYMDQPMTLFTTLAHEGYPGHLYQTVYYAGTNPDPVRSIFRFGGYLEGWATYAEMCGYYLADIPKAEATMLQKNNAVLLGIYALTDIGIHYDGWSREEAAAFLGRYGIREKKTADRIYDLILGSPANYVMYYIGYLEILELKRDWIKEHGAGSASKEFHRAVLGVGPAPFPIVRDYMESPN